MVNKYEVIQIMVASLLCVLLTLFVFTPMVLADTNKSDIYDLWNVTEEFEETASLRKFLIERDWIDNSVTVEELDYILVLTRQLQSNFFPDVPAPLVLAIISIESGFQKDLHGFNDDTGLMQIIPKYHMERIVKYIYEDGCDLFDPRVNLMVGMDYLNELLSEFEGDISGALMGYNMGPNRSHKLRSNGWISSYAEEALARMDDIWIFLERG